MYYIIRQLETEENPILVISKFKKKPKKVIEKIKKKFDLIEKAYGFREIDLKSCNKVEIIEDDIIKLIKDAKKTSNSDFKTFDKFSISQLKSIDILKVIKDWEL